MTVFIEKMCAFGKENNDGSRSFYTAIAIAELATAASLSISASSSSLSFSLILQFLQIRFRSPQICFLSSIHSYFLVRILPNESIDSIGNLCLVQKSRYAKSPLDSYWLYSNCL